MNVFVVTKTTDYLALVECYSDRQDAETRIFELACEECRIDPNDMDAFEQLQNECAHGIITATRIDLGAMNSPVYEVTECKIN